MTKLEIENKTYQVPDSWEDLTLGQYEHFVGLPGETRTERVERVAYLAGMDPQDLLRWPVDVYNVAAGLISFIFEEAPKSEPSPGIEIEGVKFAVNIADRLTLGEWVDAEEAQKDPAEVISGVLAVVCRPVGEKYDPSRTESRAALFKAQPVLSLMPVIAVFLTFNDLLAKSTQQRSDLEELAGLLQNVGGITASPGAGTTGSPRSQGATSLNSTRSQNGPWAKYLLSLFTRPSATKREQRSASSTTKTRKNDDRPDN